jgi:rubrerythrin
MAVLFKGCEILDVALEIEKTGQAFYEELSKCARDEGVKKVVGFMVGEEAEHFKTFKVMQEALACENFTRSESYPGEYEAYVKALADSRVFTNEHDIREECRRLGNDSDAIQMAIELEKDSIVFYNEMTRFVRESDKPTIARVVDEERGHIVKLWELKTKLAAA